MEAKDKLKNINGRLVNLFKANQSTMMAFKGLTDSVNKDGAVSHKMKELVAVAIAVATKCDDCILYHLDAAKKHGATREEVIDVLSVTVEMAGGPGAVYASKALEYYDSL